MRNDVHLLTLREQARLQGKEQEATHYGCVVIALKGSDVKASWNEDMDFLPFDQWEEAPALTLPNELRTSMDKPLGYGGAYELLEEAYIASLGKPQVHAAITGRQGICILHNRHGEDAQAYRPVYAMAGSKEQCLAKLRESAVVAAKYMKEHIRPLTAISTYVNDDGKPYRQSSTLAQENLQILRHGA